MKSLRIISRPSDETVIRICLRFGFSLADYAEQVVHATMRESALHFDNLGYVTEVTDEGRAELAKYAIEIAKDIDDSYK